MTHPPPDPDRQQRIDTLAAELATCRAIGRAARAADQQRREQRRTEQEAP